jgi:pectate lyase-like protein
LPESAAERKYFEERPDSMMQSTPAPRVQHIADGQVSEFTFDFAIFQSSDLEVFLDACRQMDGFSVAGTYPADGGTVVFQRAPAAGTAVTLRRRLSIERTTDFQPAADLLANTLDAEFDRLVAILQQVDGEASLAVHAGPTEADANLLLPARESRAGRILAFDEAGNVTTVAASPPELPSLDDIPEGANNKHFTSSEKAKLATVEPQSEANPPRVTTDEKANGSELSLRSFAPRDIADMARTCAPAGAVSSVFGRTGAVGAQTGDYTADQIGDTANKVMMTSAERTKLAGFVTVTDFGAVGDGVADDTAAFVAAAAYAVQKKKALRVPAGTYLLKKSISFANAPVALIGDGIGLSILKWTADATTLGISITSNADTQFHLIRDLSFYVAKKGGTAVTLDYTGQVDSVISPGAKVTMNRSSPRFLIENCSFSGAADERTTGWDGGVDSIAAIKGNIINCSFNGWLQGTATITPGSPFAFFRGINSNYENGHPCEFLVEFCSVYYTIACVIYDGVEGGYVGSCNFTAVTYGVIWEDGFGRPQLYVTNCQINAYNTSILARNCAGFTALGNLLYGRIDARNPTNGILLRGTIPGGCDAFLITGNTFENHCRTQGFNGVIIEQGSYGLITGNAFRTNGVATTTAIWLTSGSSNCRVGADNIYGTQITNRVLNQGQNNVIAK